MLRAGLDHRLDLAGRAGQARRRRDRAARPGARPVAADARGPLHRAAARPTPSSCQPLRLDRLQGAVALPRLPRAVRRDQGATDDERDDQPADPAPAGLPPAAGRRVDRLTDDAVAITFAVPPELRETFAFRAGQHLTVRRTDDRRGRPPLVLDLLDARRAGRARRCCGSASRRSPAARSPAYAASAPAPPATRSRCCRRWATSPPAFDADRQPALRRDRRRLRHHAGAVAGRHRARRPSRHSRFTLVYGNRYARSVMFAEELADLKDRYPARLHLVHVLSREPRRVRAALRPARRRRGSAGCSTRSCRPATSTSGSSADRTGWCSTPSSVLAERGVPDKAVHTELFHVDEAPEPPRRPAPPTGRRAGRGDHPARRPGVHAADGAATSGSSTRRCGCARELPYACKGGVCSTCRARIVEGEVTMARNYALEPDELGRRLRADLPVQPGDRQAGRRLRRLIVVGAEPR